VRELLEEYVPRVYRLALRLTGDAHAAEDLTQETLLRAWRRLDRLRAPGAARVWLFRITVNLWRDQLRRGRSPVARAGKLADDIAGRCVPPDRAAADQEAVRRALKAMEALPTRQRQVLYLNACEGLSAPEAAEVLGISPTAAKASLSLARKRLRDRLRDHWEGLPLPGER
jgi:RNA polymerase sigma-70 factor (ECF subfamily)